MRKGPTSSAGQHLGNRRGAAPVNRAGRLGAVLPADREELLTQGAL